MPEENQSALPPSAQEQRDYEWLQAQSPEQQLALLTTDSGDERPADDAFWTQLHLSLRYWRALAAQPVETARIWPQRLASHAREVNVRAAALSASPGVWLRRPTSRAELRDHLQTRLIDWVMLRHFTGELVQALQDPTLNLEQLGASPQKATLRVANALNQALRSADNCAALLRTWPAHKTPADPTVQKEWTELACAREFNRMLREFGADPEQVRTLRWGKGRTLNRSGATWAMTRPGHDLSAQEWTTLWIERASWFSEQDRPPTWTAAVSSTAVSSTAVSSTEPGEAAQGRPGAPSRWAELLPGVTLWATQWQDHEAVGFAIEHIRPGASHATWTPVQISEMVNDQHESKGEAAQRWIYEHPLVGELISRAPTELSPELAAVRAALGRYWDT